jgi:putative endonuclease
MPSGRQALGSHGEMLAAEWYVQHGYVIVERNWRVAEGEIDLVARRDRVLVFCEVKTRTSDRFGTAAEAVTAAKQRRLRRLAAVYLHRRESSSKTESVRFDVACVRGNDIEVIEQAF